MKIGDSSFKDLQKKWYKKLAKTGFVDVETDQGDLKVPEHRHYRQHDGHTNRYSVNEKTEIAGIIQRAESAAEYYRLAGDFLREYKFKSAADKRIWASHAEGATVREMASVNKRWKVHTKSPIGRTLKRLRDVFLTFEWQAKDE